MSLTAEQLRAARAMLRLEQTELAAKAGVSVETVKRLESSRGKLSAQSDTLSKITRALRAEGIEFIDSDRSSVQGGPGVRMSTDRNTALIMIAGNEARLAVIGALRSICFRDPHFFEKPVAHQVSELQEAVVPLLGRLLSEAFVQLDPQE